MTNFNPTISSVSEGIEQQELSHPAGRSVCKLMAISLSLFLIVCNSGDPGLIPGLGRSPGEGNGIPLHYTCLENSIDNAKECSNYRTIALISHASKVMLKILQARLQQYVNRQLPDVQASFRKGRGTRDQIANICWIIKKAREVQKNIYFCFIDYAKAFDCVDPLTVWILPLEKPICRSGSNN